jgi:hypothetical protein
VIDQRAAGVRAGARHVVDGAQPRAAAPGLDRRVDGHAGAGGADRGHRPWVVALVVLVAYNTFFFAYQNTMYLALQHGTAGRLFRHGQTRPLAITYPVLALIALAASVPWWHALHLI